MKRRHPLALLAITVVLFSGCSDDDDGPVDLCESFTSVIGVKNLAGQNVSSFAAGEPITFELQILNTSAGSQTLTIPDACPQVRFEVRNSSDQVVWTSADNMGCAQVLTSVTYPAGHAATHSAVWGQALRDGTRASNGSYVLEGIDRSECSAGLSEPASFDIQ